MSQSNEGLQYALLGLVSGLEGYVKRSQQLQDQQTHQDFQMQQMQARHDYDQPYRDKQIANIDSEIANRASETRVREGKVDSASAVSPWYRELGSARHAYAFQSDNEAQNALNQFGWNDQGYDQALEHLDRRIANVNTEIPDPTGDPDMISQREKDAVQKARNQKLEMLHDAKGMVRFAKSMRLSSAGPRGSALQSQAPAPMATQPGPMLPTSQPTSGGQPPAPAAAGMPAQPMPQQGGGFFDKVFGGIKGAMGGGGPSPITPPRVATAGDAAEQNYQNMVRGDQGPMAMGDDHHRAGMFASLGAMAHDHRFMESLPLETQAAIWQKLSTLGDIPVPDPFRALISGQGMGRGAIDDQSMGAMLQGLFPAQAPRGLGRGAGYPSQNERRGTPASRPSSPGRR